MLRARDFRRLCVTVVVAVLGVWCIPCEARASEDDLRDDPSLPREERIRRHNARLKKLEDKYRAEALDHERQRLEDKLKALEQQRQKLGKQPQSVAELLGQIGEEIAKARAHIESAKEVTRKFQELKDEDLRDDPDLPRDERIRRHKMRLQDLRARCRAHDAEKRLQELQQRRETIVESQAQFEAELAETLKRAEAAESEEQRAEEKGKALEELRAEGRAKLGETVMDINRVESKRQSMEERLKEIGDEYALGSGALSPEDANERRSRLEQEQGEIAAWLGAAVSEKQHAEDRRIAYEDQLRRLEAMLAEVIAAAPLAPEVSPAPVSMPPAEPAERVGEAKVALAPVTEPPDYATVVREPEAVPVQRGGIKGFLRDRALDLCDLFRFRVHVPRGYRSVGVKARGTVLAQAGIVYFDGKSIGVDRRGAGVWRERRFEGGIGPVYFSNVTNEMIAGNRFTDVRWPWSRLHRRGIVRNGLSWEDGRLHPLSCGVELQLFAGGLEFEVYPLQCFDIVLGWLGLDSANDDESRILRRWAEIQSVPELQVRDEWSESLELEAERPAGRRAAKEIAPPAEEPIAEPEPFEPESPQK